MASVNKISRRVMKKLQNKSFAKLDRSVRKFCTVNAEHKNSPIFAKVLIANRGEIACRIIATLKKMGIKSVAVFSLVDASSKHVKLADEAVCIGEATATNSYLNIPKIMEAVRSTRADAVHPGYGFLSENPKFVEMLEKENITFIGPSLKAIVGMGDKLESKRLAIAGGVNTIPGYDDIILNEDHCVDIANSLGYPVMIKASAGGGGKGMRIAHNNNEAKEGFNLASQEALSSFGDGRLIIEKLIENPRHIEIQVLGDKHGNSIYLYERECSIQRRNQKIIEEAPSTFLDETTRRAMGEQAVRLCKILGYSSAGTVEFLVDEHKKFYFLEMNTRLQVEHPVTECVTGIDIVEQMIRVSSGEELKLKQEDIKINGWAIESRIYAEDPYKNFGIPNIGRLHKYREPNKLEGIRCDSGVEEGSEISIYYDPMISKLIGYGRNRNDAVIRIVKALDNYIIRGVTHNIPLLRDILTEERFLKGQINTNYLNSIYPSGFQTRKIVESEKLKLLAVSAALYVSRDQKSREYLNGPKILIHARNLEIWELVLSLENEKIKTHVQQTNGYFKVKIADQLFEIPKKINLAQDIITTEINGEMFILQLFSKDASGNYKIIYKGTTHSINIVSKDADDLLQVLPEKIKSNGSKQKKIKAPMSGLIKSVTCRKGDSVAEGDQLCVIEAMKMQNAITAASHGKIKKVLIEEGDTVGDGDVIVTLE